MARDANVVLHDETNDYDGTSHLRDVRDALNTAVLAGELSPGAFPTRYAQAVDEWLSGLLDEATTHKTRGYALVAVGGYGRRELCPGSDLDVVLIHRLRRNFRRVAQGIWYRIWDVGVHLDHSVRTRREALSVAQSDLKAILGMQDGRVITGDNAGADRLLVEVRDLWKKLAPSYLDEFDEQSQHRHQTAGELAFLLEPDLKQSAGGLRDAAGLKALSIAFPELANLVEAPEFLAAETLLISARVALQCRTRSTSDRLLLQEQDGIAEMLSFSDADELMAAMAEAGRTISARFTEGWRRARACVRRPTATHGRAEEHEGMGIVVRNDEAALAKGADPSSDATLVLRLATVAAQHNIPIERESLDRLALEAKAPNAPWTDALRDAFIALFSSGRPLVTSVEALDQRHLLELYLPEWSAVRNLPQRNAYHRFTVDRHLLEAVANARDHFEDVDRPDLLVIAALFHDIGKGSPGDHSEAGKEIVESVARRMGFDERDVETLTKLVSYHLVLAEVATRRDLNDPATATVVAKLLGNRSNLALLAALSEADGLATGTAAWGPWKAELVALLVERVGQVLDGIPLDVGPPAGLTDEQRELLAAGELGLSVNGRRVTFVAPDRPGLLATVAGALALNGCNVRRASAIEASPGMAMEIFEVEPAFDRLPDFERVKRDVAAALAGTLELDERLAEQDHAYAHARRPVAARTADARVVFDNETSELASIVEVRAIDRMGLLHRITAAFASSGVDVVSAIVDTLGHEVVDTFYVRNQSGGKLNKRDIDEVQALIEGVLSNAA
jgi:[protein-PII] uridylyltransferase